MANHEATCPPEAKKKMTDEFMAIMGGNAELKAEKDGARDAKFAGADANGDSLLNAEEMVAFHKLMQAWRTERYGGISAELPEEDAKAWGEAMNGMTPENNGVSLDDFKRLETIFMACLTEAHAAK